MLFKSLLFFGAGSADRGDRRAGYGAARRPDPPHAATPPLAVPGREHRDLRAAAVEWLRLGMADLPEHPGQPATAAMGLEDRWCRPSACCWRSPPRWPPPASSGPSASTSLGRPRTTAAAQRARGRSLVARRHDRLVAALCLLAGISSRLRDRLAAAGRARARPAAACRRRRALPWLSIVPIAASRSSYNGLVIFLFLLAAGSLTACGHPPLRLARRAPGPAWDCGFPDPRAARNNRDQLRPTDPPRLRHGRVRRA